MQVTPCAPRSCAAQGKLCYAANIIRETLRLDADDERRWPPPSRLFILLAARAADELFRKRLYLALFDFFLFLIDVLRMAITSSSSTTCARTHNNASLKSSPRKFIDPH